MDYANFSVVATPVNVGNRGILNGYKINSILHSGRVVSLSKNNYYIPKTKEVVSYRGIRAKVMVATKDGKLNFQEKLLPRGVIPFKVDAAEVHRSAYHVFG